MSLRSRFWVLKYDELTVADAGQLDEALTNTAGMTITFRTGEQLVTRKRQNETDMVIGNLKENGDIYAISKDALFLIQSPLLKEVLKIILEHNHGGTNASAYTEARTDHRSK